MLYTKKDHTFVICAYKENQYLEECINSIKSQTLLGKILISTSTSNKFLEELSLKHNIPLMINNDGGNIVKDWNYSYHLATTKLVTLVHQDDIYLPNYLEKALKYLNNSKKPLLFFCNYLELKNDKEIFSNYLLIVKRLLLFPLSVCFFQKNKLFRKLLLSIGNPICCPTMTYLKENLPEIIFSEGYSFAVDWMAWVNISRIDGDFIYTKEILLKHRIYKESTTSKSINNNIRLIGI